jgi:hypothetical protein
MLQLAVVGEQQQALAVGVEPASRVDIGHIDEIGQGLAFGMRRELAHYLEGFVE